MNLFIRSFVAYPTMSSHGYQMGGAIGSLKTIVRLTEEIQPKMIYAVWEGGGSSKRRSIFPEYKNQRKPIRLNRFYGDDIPDTDDNKQHQILTLLKLLKNIPICQIYASDCEGDDVIAYLCNGPLRTQKKIIVSSDKDMYQLLDDNTKQYSLHKKTYVTKENVFDEFRIASKNFALAKALCGDKGDNVPGVKGLGFKKVSVLFPMLGTDEDIILQSIFDYAVVHEKLSPLYTRILQNENEIRRNWKLVYLDGSMVAPNQTVKINHVIDNFKPNLDKMSLIRLLSAEGVTGFDVETVCYAFQYIKN